ncbi:MAG: glycosyltransferase family 2 protein [Pseudobutyrivibrio sp.]|nr:glycosyltransferase family 2 protein [Pseudobutyrivibrio sp.]
MIKGLYEQVQRMEVTGSRFWSYQYKINKLIVNALYPAIQNFNYKSGIEPNSDVVVSLTTYPARIKTVWMTIASLMNQTYKPLHIVLYLSKEQFPDGENGLPKKLFGLKKRGLTIKFVDGDLKPHKKYFYAFKEFKDKYVLTADDDVFYPENHIEQFIKAIEKYPEAIICNRSHLIAFDESHEFLPYKKWTDNVTEIPDMLTLAVGGNGVMYRPRMFSEEIFNENNIINSSLYTDDLWLKAMEVRDNIPVYNYASSSLVYFDNLRNKETGLWHVNTSDGKNRNDIAWEDIIKLYPEVKEKLYNNYNESDIK